MIFSRVSRQNVLIFLSLVGVLSFIFFGLNFEFVVFFLQTGGGLQFIFLFGSGQKIFFLFCFIISAMIIFFSKYYMNSYEYPTFSKCLGLFMIFMLSLVGSGNLFTMFIGWEGVGVLSFILIGWFSSRDNALYGSKKAVLYNRFGDFFMIVLIVWEGAKNLLFQEKGYFFFREFFSKNLYWLSIFVLGLMCCVIVKSAQFSFLPWLTSAMEGPTPVSALLHSSTMVVAGVYFFFANFYFFQEVALEKIVFFLGGFTVFYSSLSALYFQDMKKVIALSTASQLGFMLMLISLNLKEWAFFHLLLHGFFKALLFLFSGSVIHSQFNNQTLKVSSNQKSNYMKLGIWISILSLGGLPFLGSFFSKHFILLVFFSSGDWISSFMVFFFYMSICLTLSYAIKLGFTMGSFKFFFKKNSMQTPPTGVVWSEILPLLSLLMLTCWSGGIFLDSFMSKHHFFVGAVYIAWSLLEFLLGGYFLYFFSTHWFSTSYFLYSFLGGQMLNKQFLKSMQLLGAKTDETLEKQFFSKVFKKNLLQYYDVFNGMGFPQMGLLRFYAVTFFLLNFGWLIFY